MFSVLGFADNILSTTVLVVFQREYQCLKVHQNILEGCIMYDISGNSVSKRIPMSNGTPKHFSRMCNVWHFHEERNIYEGWQRIVKYLSNGMVFKQLYNICIAKVVD